METPSEKTQQNSLHQILKWSGGFYLLLSVIAAQIGSSVVAIPITLISQINAEFPTPEFLQYVKLTVYFSLLEITVLIFFSYLFNIKVFHGIQRWKIGNTLPAGSPGEYAAWKQINAWPLKYAILASSTRIFIVGLPLLYYLNRLVNASFDQTIYFLIGMTIIVLAVITLNTSILDHLLIPVRQALLPKSFDTQLEGAIGLTLSARIYVVVPAMIILSILLIAPIGYHQTVTVLYREIGSAEVLRTLQVQSIIVSGFAVFLGLGLVFLFSKSLTNPLNDMIAVFKKVEQGDLKQRVRIVASDEISQVAIYFNRMISRLDELQTTLERQVDDRTAQLRAIIEVGQAAISILDPDQLMVNIVNLIQDQFGHYYTGIYLVDSSGRWAELKEATGEAGRALKNSKHRLEINDQTLIGRTLRKGEAQVIMDADKEIARFEHPLLPYTRSEIALPLVIGDRILGALDVQSTQEAIFGQQDVETLQNMANQVAIALENARLFQATQENLQELRNIQRQYLHQAWVVSDLPHSETTLSIGDETDVENLHSIDVQIALRDQVIGNILLEKDQNVTAEESTWIQAIATQAALALENARLLEESQSLAFRERLIADITGKIWNSTTVEGVMQTAIQELGRSLQASEATIEINISQNVGRTE